MRIKRSSLKVLIERYLSEDDKEENKDRVVKDEFGTTTFVAPDLSGMAAKFDKQAAELKKQQEKGEQEEKALSQAKTLQRWATKTTPVKSDNSMSAFNPEFRSKVEKILAALRQRGPSEIVMKLAANKGKPLPDKFEPMIYTAFRSLRDQKKAKEKGRSQTDGFGFHVAYGDDDGKDSWAADIVDKNYMWGSGKSTIQKMAMWEFFQALGQEAAKVGIKDDMWGGNWNRKNRQGKPMGHMLTPDGWVKGSEGEETLIGWDSAHIQGKENSKEEKQKLKTASLVQIMKLKNQGKTA